MNEKPDTPKKKPYQEGKLRVYGTIEALTQLNAAGTKVDTSKGLNKTA